jgi:hypothetical protein
LGIFSSSLSSFHSLLVLRLPSFSLLFFYFKYYVPITACVSVVWRYSPAPVQTVRCISKKCVSGITVILAEFDPLLSQVANPNFFNPKKEPPPHQRVQRMWQQVQAFSSTARQLEKSLVRHVFCEGVYPRIRLPTVGGVTPRMVGGGTATNTLWEVFLRNALHVVGTYG